MCLDCSNEVEEINSREPTTNSPNITTNPQESVPTYLPPTVNHPSAINGECRADSGGAAHLIGLTCNTVSRALSLSKFYG